MKTWVEISRQNILHNIKSLKLILRPEVKFMAVVKSNAYGHGLEEVSKICAHPNKEKLSVDWFGVDSIDEALILRKLKIRQPILVLGYVPFERVVEAVANDISIVAYHKELLIYLERRSKLNKNFQSPPINRDNFPKLKIHIKVETGTSRQGIGGEELLKFVIEAAKNKNILIEGIYTHYANIEDTADSSYAAEQLKRFNDNLKMLDSCRSLPRTTIRGRAFPVLDAGNDKRKWSDTVIKHTACSAAIINYPQTFFNMVRAGISLYGMWPSAETKLVARQKKINLELKPALIWKTRIIQIKKVRAGTPIGYGLTEKVRRETTLAVLPIGYWDGYDRGLSGFSEVLIKDKRAKVLGRICMNMTIVDITDITGVKLFDEVILLGKSELDEITAEEIAKKLGTINYEITTRINPLIPRIII